MRAMRIHPSDSVAVALEPLSKGDSVNVDGTVIHTIDDIPFGHKFALNDIPAKADLYKYGHPIGHATQRIPQGAHVHSHNLKTNLSGTLDYVYAPRMPKLPQPEPLLFDGYARPNGTVGIRNEIWILPTVGCVNGVCQNLAHAANAKWGQADVFAFPHNMGCSQLGDDMANTQHILKGLVNNPNAGGVLLVGLGCENNTMDSFLRVLGEYDPNRVKTLIAQDTPDELETGLLLIERLRRYTGTFSRTRVSASKLVVGMKCGGSDAFSGITANPLVGRVNDALVALGGTTILTEVPEMFGAETLFMARAANESVFQDIVSLINREKEYFLRHNQPVYENPSPGNKAGGITTLEEKSLGCTQKGGRAPVVGVLDMGDTARFGGLNLLNGPGNDQISITNLAASGAQMILFTTGRGNPLGAPVPTVKISSNSALAMHKSRWIDYDAGRMLHDPADPLPECMQFILDVASGKKRAKNEEYGFREISVFRDGVIL